MTPAADGIRYAGFWRRSIALLVDAVLFGLLWAIVGAAYALAEDAVLQGSVFRPDGSDLSRALTLFGVGEWVVLFVLVFSYFALLEALPGQGTPGKRLFGLRVADRDGKRVGIGRSVARTALKPLAAAILMVGYVMAAFTRRKQALHDVLSGSVVIRRS